MVQDHRSYPSHSWLDPRIAVRRSPIDGLGLFATAPIRAGEIVIRWGGRPITDEELRALERRWRETGEPYSCAAIGEGLSLLQDDDDPLRYGNHSCDPNLWLADAVTETARRAIVTGEELTFDYALATVVPWSMPCRCGAPDCRGVIAGDDWQLPELQLQYRGHFSPFINARIGE
ncbi:MAG TPA: SET domain-containing protein-lysine N-methyltransferase [Thermomicrobiales bacterium]